MPYPLLAHQAPVLPLKAWWPGYLNGTVQSITELSQEAVEWLRQHLGE